MTLTELFDEAIARKASDIHLAIGEAPCVRIDGRLVRLDIPAIDAGAMADLTRPALTGNLESHDAEGFALSTNTQSLREAHTRLASGTPVERTLVRNGIAFSSIVFRVGSDGLAATYRVLGDGAPSLEVVGEGAISLLQRIIDAPRGLAILSGPTGSGKWTTACSMIDRINETKDARIFVVESHPSYYLSSKRGMLTQLHVGQDCDSYERAMETALQADVDVIALDDIPTAEALRQALILAATGHLVLANLHAESAVDAVSRLLLASPDAQALRAAVASNLITVVGQRLYRRAARPGRVPVYEWIANTPAIRQAISSSDLVRLAELQTTDPECRTASDALDTLREAGEIEAEQT